MISGFAKCQLTVLSDDTDGVFFKYCLLEAQSALLIVWLATSVGVNEIQIFGAFIFGVLGGICNVNNI
jgi:hypothetical protein